MSVPLSATFLADLALVYASLQPLGLSAAFLSELVHVCASIAEESESNFGFLVTQFQEWRTATEETIQTRLAQLHQDDPLLCPISLFRTMDYGRLETAHTRTLAWLLDPNGEHGFGDTLLEALIRKLVGENAPVDLRNVRVHSEYPIDSFASGRLDLLAEGAWGDERGIGWTLLIEAKVDAQEGVRQLDKYDEWLSVHAIGRDVYRIFLTPSGHAPESGAEEWSAMSYLELVKIFRGVYGGLSHKPGFHFLKFYLAGILQDICGWPRNFTSASTDPYAINSYLQSIRNTYLEDASHETTR